MPLCVCVCAHFVDVRSTFNQHSINVQNLMEINISVGTASRQVKVKCDCNFYDYNIKWVNLKRIWQIERTHFGKNSLWPWPEIERKNCFKIRNFLFYNQLISNLLLEILSTKQIEINALKFG